MIPGQDSDLTCACLYERQCGNVFTVSDSVSISQTRPHLLLEGPAGRRQTSLFRCNTFLWVFLHPSIHSFSNPSWGCMMSQLPSRQHGYGHGHDCCSLESPHLPENLNSLRLCLSRGGSRGSATAHGEEHCWSAAEFGGDHVQFTGNSGYTQVPGAWITSLNQLVTWLSHGCSCHDVSPP